LVALVVCIAAFVLGFVPLLGLLLGLVGLVLVALVVRRGVATKRTYVGAGAAALGALASLATTVLVVGAVLAPGAGSGPEPVAATSEASELDEEAEEGAETAAADTDEETDAAEEAQPAVVEDPVETEEPEPAETEEAEPSEDPTTEPAEEVDLSNYKELDQRELAHIGKSPDDHIGEQVILYGTITQLDAATGKCFVRVSISHAPQDDWYDYEHNSVGFAGDGESDCPVLDPFVADDEVKLWVTIGGSLSYDTQIGGSTTVPAYLIADAELL